jgi:hypothetical protein
MKSPAKQRQAKRLHVALHVLNQKAPNCGQLSKGTENEIKI